MNLKENIGMSSCEKLGADLVFFLVKNMKLVSSTKLRANEKTGFIVQFLDKDIMAYS